MASWRQAQRRRTEGLPCSMGREAKQREHSQHSRRVLQTHTSMRRRRCLKLWIPHCPIPHRSVWPMPMRIPGLCPATRRPLGPKWWPGRKRHPASGPPPTPLALAPQARTENLPRSTEDRSSSERIRLHGRLLDQRPEAHRKPTTLHGRLQQDTRAILLRDATRVAGLRNACRRSATKCLGYPKGRLGPTGTERRSLAAWAAVPNDYRSDASKRAPMETDVYKLTHSSLRSHVIPQTCFSHNHGSTTSRRW